VQQAQAAAAAAAAAGSTVNVQYLHKFLSNIACTVTKMYKACANT
jgi:hypothetical protein